MDVVSSAIGIVGTVINLVQAVRVRLDALEGMEDDKNNFKGILRWFDRYLRETDKLADAQGTSFEEALEGARDLLKAIEIQLTDMAQRKSRPFTRALNMFDSVKHRGALREKFQDLHLWMTLCNNGVTIHLVAPGPPSPSVPDPGQSQAASRDSSTQAPRQPSTPVPTLQRSAGFRSESGSSSFPRFGPGPGLESKPVSGSTPSAQESTQATAAADTPATSRASSRSTASASIRRPGSSTSSRHPPARSTKSAVDVSTAGRSGGEPRLLPSGKPTLAPSVTPAPVPALELHCYGSMPMELPYVQPSTPRWSDLATALSLPFDAGGLSSAKTRLAVARQDGTVRLLDTSTLDPVGEWAAVGPLAAGSSLLGMNLLSCVCWRGDGAQLAVGDGDGTITLWDLSGRGGHPGASPLLQVSSLHVPLSCLDWNPVHGGLIAAGSNADATIRIVDTALAGGNTGPGIHQLAPQAQVGSVSTVHWHPQGVLLASGHDDGHVCVWDTSARQLWAGPFRHESNSGTWRRGAVTSVHWSPDGNRLASSGKDRVFRIWDWRSGQVLYTLPAQADVILCVRWSPDGRRLACAAGSKILVVAAGHADAYRLEATLEGHTRQVVDISWQPDGRRLASGSVDDTVRIWRMGGQGQPEAVLSQGQCVYCVAWQPSSVGR